jgi:adenylate kinase
MLREAVDQGSELGRRVHDIMVTGELVDDATMAEVVRTRLAAADADRGFVLDGFPRTLTQAAELDSILAMDGQRLDAVIAIEVPEATLTERTLARQRADDKAEVIRERLRVYRAKTEPLVDFYRGRGQLLAVNGHQPVEEVTRSILSSLSAEA